MELGAELGVALHSTEREWRSMTRIRMGLYLSLSKSLSVGLNSQVILVFEISYFLKFI